MDAQAFYPTEHAAKYVRQLASHFAHKIEVTDTEDGASFALKAAQVRLTARPDGLHAAMTAESAGDLIEARFVIDKHLVSFAFRENFIGMNWV
ncbi:MAG: DUF2218 domain-containing protein [Paracoccus sp. (in: a-proteobacteria)]|uniref:DUF2218 domain-containing protein n=1 Tax=Paracoccus sp. TaxID=267 RepID=UPI0026E02C6F|nr:DUF2218 domain-containing protein [Paracoccus sp. (in: a-proteobacteria)]MDO5614006.1 DUF2218 domain-containing protein [Paracoccus sp. (in: a-proteobacteria)]MDO5632753.1 DUF2218 domain-containing protein [Paracoccus sp. (in: a-proteobacteria)]